MAACTWIDRIPTGESAFVSFWVAARAGKMEVRAILLTLESTMKLPNFKSLPSAQEGKVGYILLWALGVPIPILFLIYLLRGCT
jgi:hypothetical protein